MSITIKPGLKPVEANTVVAEAPSNTRVSLWRAFEKIPFIGRLFRQQTTREPVVVAPLFVQDEEAAPAVTMVSSSTILLASTEANKIKPIMFEEQETDFYKQYLQRKERGERTISDLYMGPFNFAAAYSLTVPLYIETTRKRPPSQKVDDLQTLTDRIVTALINAQIKENNAPMKTFERANPDVSPSLETRLNIAQEQFDYWMENYTHPQRTHEENLAAWLHMDNGGKLISNFDDFALLARRIRDKGYDIRETPSQEKFNEAMQIFEEQMKMREQTKRAVPKSSLAPRLLTQQEEIITTALMRTSMRDHNAPMKIFERANPDASPSLEMRLNIAQEQFDYWMKNYTHAPPKTDEEELVDWLYMDDGGKLISNFEEFALLARRVCDKGYDIRATPSQEKFNEAMQIFEERMKSRK